MDYPLNVVRAAKGNDPAGFAVASDESEHAILTAYGYTPAYVAPPAEESHEDKAGVMAELDKAGVTYDKRMGLAKLKALLPA